MRPILFRAVSNALSIVRMGSQRPVVPWAFAIFLYGTIMHKAVIMYDDRVCISSFVSFVRAEPVNSFDVRRRPEVRALFSH